jgi:DNA-binding transcriptional regulator YdaS (Cro superfamily)
MSALHKAIETLGGQTALAEAIHGAPQLVNNWVRRGGLAPEDKCPAIENATRGAVSCEELRPDVAWIRIPDQTWPHPQGRPLVDHSHKPISAEVERRD